MDLLKQLHHPEVLQFHILWWSHGVIQQHLVWTTIRNCQYWKQQTLASGLQGKMLLFAGLVHGHAWSLVVSSILVNEGFPQKHASLWLSKTLTCLLFFCWSLDPWTCSALKCRPETADFSKQKKVPCLEIRKALLPGIPSSQISELQDILFGKIRWSASHLGFSSWYKQAQVAEV